MMRCPKCGFDNGADFKFCLKCGTPLASQATGAQPPPPAGAQQAQQKNGAALACSNCGATNFKKTKKMIGSGEDAEYVSVAKCGSCGTLFDKDSPQFYNFFKGRYSPRKHDYYIKPGTKGALDGVEYEILGRIRYNDQEEYEVETWDEWYMVSQYGDRSWLVYEEGEFFLYKKTRPKQELSFDESGIRFDGKSLPRSAIYNARIGYVEGQLPWEAEIGELVQCCDFKKDGKKYCIEKSESEIEVYSAERLDPLQLFVGFNQKEYTERYRVSILQRKIYKKKALIYLIAALITFAWTVVNCQKGSEVARFNAGRKVGGGKVISGRPISHNKIRYGPFTLKKGNTIHSFVLNCRRLYREWVEAYVTLKDSNRKEVFGFTSGFWHETGYDSDGPWSESDLYDTQSFVLEKSGTYYLVVEIGAKKRWQGWNLVSLRLIAGERSYTYLLFASMFFFILFFVAKSKASTHSRFPFRLKM